MAHDKAVTDRNLLIGILAVQMDFIGGDQLLAAMHGWIRQKHRGLEEVLAEQGALDEDECSLLAGLITKHLERHNGDAALSLASISSVDSQVCQQLRDLDDDDVDASLVQVESGSPEQFDKNVDVLGGKSHV